MASTERSEDISSSYIIEQFLPDVAALAAVTQAASQRKKKNLSYLTATVKQSCFSPSCFHRKLVACMCCCCLGALSTGFVESTTHFRNQSLLQKITSLSKVLVVRLLY
ncbi:unnamed protein product [Brassica rapa]|uniref:Uncharacterized protein n=1 Tax=Brassica campestris TaxID=3711 RepID=A0A8D9GNF0_BRACM|nr:unnamed protein product [Brassica rapa]